MTHYPLALASTRTFLNRVHCLDAETLLRSLPANSIHCIVTSPPYFGLRDYETQGQIGMESRPGEYIDRLVAVFDLARRVLRDDGTLWLNLGDSYSSNVGGICDLSRGQSKNTSKGYRYHIQSNRNGQSGLPPKNMLGIPWRVAFALQESGWILRSEIIWQKLSPMPESVKDRPTKAHEQVFLFAKSPHYYYDYLAIAEPSHGANGSSFTTYKTYEAAQRQRPVSLKPRQDAPYRNRRTVWPIASEPLPFQHFAAFPSALVEPMILAGCPAKVCAACGAPYAAPVARTFTLQEDVSPERAIKGANGQKPMYTGNRWSGFPRGSTCYSSGSLLPTCDCAADHKPGIVLDMFAGSGRVALVALRLGRDFIGGDLNPGYVELANLRRDYGGDDARLLNELRAGVRQINMFNFEVE